MTDLDAARARAIAAQEAWNRGDYAAAARDWTKAAEHLESETWDRTASREAMQAAGAGLRRSARAAIIRRDPFTAKTEGRQ